MMSCLISVSSASAPSTFPPIFEVFFQYRSHSSCRKRSALVPGGGSAPRLAPEDRVLEWEIRTGPLFTPL